jgi:hypothetical protein
MSQVEAAKDTDDLRVEVAHPRAELDTLKRGMADEKATADAVIKPAPLVLGKHTAKAEPPAADKKHDPHKVFEWRFNFFAITRPPN